MRVRCTNRRRLAGAAPPCLRTASARQGWSADWAGSRKARPNALTERPLTATDHATCRTSHVTLAHQVVELRQPLQRARRIHLCVWSSQHVGCMSANGGVDV
jgi:hypothetical protein